LEVHEEVQSRACVELWPPPLHAGERSEERAQRLEPERQERPHGDEVHEPVAGIVRARPARAGGVEIARLEADRDRRLRARRYPRHPGRHILEGAERHRGERVRRAGSQRLEPLSERARHPAPRVGPSARATADGAAPLADPGILVVENERHLETPLQDRSQQRRVRRIDGDEQRIEALAPEAGRAGAQERRERAQPEVAEAEAAGPRRRPGAAAHDLELDGHEPRELGIEPLLVVARIDRHHRR
jgi:hypothetical protein